MVFAALDHGCLQRVNIRDYKAESEAALRVWVEELCRQSFPQGSPASVREDAIVWAMMGDQSLRKRWVDLLPKAATAYAVRCIFCSSRRVGSP